MSSTHTRLDRIIELITFSNVLYCDRHPILFINPRGTPIVPCLSIALFELVSSVKMETVKIGLNGELE